MPATTTALLSLEQALDAPHDSARLSASGAGPCVSAWPSYATRWSTRPTTRVDGWLVARGGAAIRERNALLERLTALGTPVLESAEVDRVRSDMKRLLTDISHHFQRLHDLAYDEVELELGGSE